MQMFFSALLIQTPKRTQRRRGYSQVTRVGGADSRNTVSDWSGRLVKGIHLFWNKSLNVVKFAIETEHRQRWHVTIITFLRMDKSKWIVITGSEFVLNYFMECRPISISMQVRSTHPNRFKQDLYFLVNKCLQRILCYNITRWFVSKWVR